jgi:hypothetical protein
MENNPLFEITEDLRQSEAYGRYMERIGWKVVRIQDSGFKIQLFIKKLGPVSFAKIQRTKRGLPMEEIVKILKINRTVMCKIEPAVTAESEVLRVNGYKISREPLLGTKTLRVNLRPKQSEILNSFKKDARYTLRKLLISNYLISKNNFGDFYTIWKQSAKRKSLWIPKKTEYESLVKAFGKNVFCLTVNDMAGALILIHKKTAFYYYAGSTNKGNALNLPYLVVWKAIQEAKNRGCQIWDFEGIYDSRWPNQGWKGFSHFKRSFGGYEFLFPGSFEKWFWPW